MASCVTKIVEEFVNDHPHHLLWYRTSAEEYGSKGAREKGRENWVS